MTRLGGLTSREARTLVGPRTVALLPLGSTEPHGPHLPLDTDVRLAVELARRVAERLEAVGVRALELPPLAYGITRLAQGHPGGVTMRPGTLWAFVEDLVLSLSQDDVRQLVVCNAHLELEQRRLLRGLSIDYPARGPGRCQLLCPERTDDEGEPLEEGAPDASCHGGRGETSQVLALDPALVRTDELARLAPVEPPSAGALLARGASVRRLGAEEAYFGDPASASPSEGEALLEGLVTGHVEAVRAAWPDLFPALPGTGESLR